MAVKLDVLDGETVAEKSRQRIALRRGLSYDAEQQRHSAMAMTELLRHTGVGRIDGTCVRTMVNNDTDGIVDKDVGTVLNNDDRVMSDAQISDVHEFVDNEMSIWRQSGWSDGDARDFLSTFRDRIQYQLQSNSISEEITSQFLQAMSCKNLPDFHEIAIRFGHQILKASAKELRLVTQIVKRVADTMRARDSSASICGRSKIISNGHESLSIDWGSGAILSNGGYRTLKSTLRPAIIWIALSAVETGDMRLTPFDDARTRSVSGVTMHMDPALLDIVGIGKDFRMDWEVELDVQNPTSPGTSTYFPISRVVLTARTDRYLPRHQPQALQTAYLFDIERGSEVVIRNLGQRSDLNDKKGVVRDWDDVRGRYVIEVSGVKVALKPPNLEPLQGMPLSAIAVDGVQYDVEWSLEYESNTYIQELQTEPHVWSALIVRLRKAYKAHTWNRDGYFDHEVYRNMYADVEGILARSANPYVKNNESNWVNSAEKLMTFLLKTGEILEHPNHHGV